MVGNVWRQSQDAKEARWGKKENTNTDAYANTNTNTCTNTNAKKKLIPNYLRWDFHISSSVNSKHSEGCFSTSQWNKMKRTTVNMK